VNNCESENPANKSQLAGRNVEKTTCTGVRAECQPQLAELVKKSLKVVIVISHCPATNIYRLETWTVAIGVPAGDVCHGANTAELIEVLFGLEMLAEQKERKDFSEPSPNYFAAC